MEYENNNPELCDNENKITYNEDNEDENKVRDIENINNDNDEIIDADDDEITDDDNDNDNDDNDDDNDDDDDEITDDDDNDDNDNDDNDNDDNDDNDDKYQNMNMMQGGYDAIDNDIDEDNEDNEDNEDDDDEDCFKKINEEIKRDFIAQVHPENTSLNYDEIRSLAKINRNKDGYITDKLHHTVPFVTCYEKAKILGIRAKQINTGAQVFVDVPNNVIDGYTIAIMEYKAKKIPFIIRRPIPNGKSEYWQFKDLEQIDF